MNQLNNGPDKSLLSDGAKPQPDPLLTPHDINMLLQFVTPLDTSYEYVDDENKFEWMIFKVSPGFNELWDLSG